METVAQSLRTAVEHQRAGRLSAAEELCRQILVVEPNHASTWNLLGVINSQLGNGELAIDQISRAIELSSRSPAFHGNLGSVYQSMNRPAEAVGCYRRALELKEDIPELHYNLGNVLRQQDKPLEAVACYRRAIELKPDYAEAHSNLGTVLQELGKAEEAVVSFRRALAIKSDFATAHYNLGNVLLQLGSADESVACYRHALELKPDYAPANYNLGNALRQLGQHEEAVACYRRAVELKPDYAEACGNLGTALHELGRTNEALACYRRALELEPDFPEALFNLGNVRRQQGENQEAVELYRRALELRPDYAEVHGSLGTVLQELGKPDEAVACLRRALELAPHDLAAVGELVHARLHLCEWEGLDALSRRAIDGVDNDAENTGSAPLSPFTFLTLPVATTAAGQLRCARQCVERHLKVPSGAARGLPADSARAQKRKLTIGYLSADFSTHATAMLIAELFEKHDRDRFTILGYSYGRDDSSPLRKRVAGAMDKFVDVRQASFAEAAERIAADEVDILVDLKGYTTEARPRIAALRPAPIQVNYLGFPGTMGAPFIDYILVDDFVVPADQQPFFTEKLVHLPGCYQVNDSRREIAERTPSRAECGLPAEGFVFCSFNNNYKITPQVFDLWMRLLGQVPGSVLWLLQGHAGAADNLRREAHARGISPDRLVFAPRWATSEHLARHRLADLFLDTFPVNAHTTASDALWAGCPLLTLAGETFVSRVAGSLLRTLGLGELVTTSLDEYERLARQLAGNPGPLAELRARLAVNRSTSALFDGERFARSIEQAYTQMWEIHSAGEPPRAFRVEQK